MSRSIETPSFVEFLQEFRDLMRVRPKTIEIAIFRKNMRTIIQQLLIFFLDQTCAGFLQKFARQFGISIYYLLGST